MKIKKALSVAFAATLAVAFSATPAFAAVNSSIENSNIDNGAFYYDLVPLGISAADVNGQTVTVSFTVDDSDGFGGGIMFNTGDGGWQQSEDFYWGNEAQPIIAEGSDGSYTLSFTVPDGTYTDNDLSGADGTWGSICVQEWWGADMEVTGVTIGAAAEATDSAATTESADDTAADTATVAQTADVAPVAGVALAIAGVALIAVAVKKRTALQ